MITFYGLSGQLYWSAKQSYSHINSKVEDLAPDQPEALSSIILSFAAIEAFLNELGELVVSDPEGAPWRSSSINAYGEEWLRLEEDRGSTSQKFRVACDVFNTGFNRGSPIYQNFSDLCSVRNALMHFRPDKAQVTEAGKVIDVSNVAARLRSKNILEKESGVFRNWTTRIQNRAAAKWACNTASECVIGVFKAIPNIPSFKGVYLNGTEQAFEPIR